MSFINTSSLMVQRTVAPAQLVSAEEFKSNARITYSDEDTLIDSLIVAATDELESECGRAFNAQTWTYSLRSPDGKSRLSLPISPVQSVSQIQYYDNDEASQTLTVSDFYLYKTEDWAYLHPKSGVSWPSLYNREDAITVTFVAGYAVLPEKLKQAVILLATHWFKNRGATTESNLKVIPFGVQKLIESHKVGWIG